MKVRFGSWFRTARWSGLLELALLAAIAIVLAQWTWVAFTPNPVAESGLSGIRGLSGTTAPVRRGLFGAATPGSTQEDPATASQFRLIGVISPSAAGRGRAIFALRSGSREVTSPGEMLSAGIVLKAVFADHVTVMHDGTIERIELDRKDAAVIARHARPDVAR